MSAWSVIGHVVTAGMLPAPMTVDTSSTRVTIKLRHRSHVDQWVAFMGMPHANAVDITGDLEHRGGAFHQYQSIDFRTDGGWCGYETLHVYTSDGGS